MQILTRDKPTGRQLFRTCAAVGLAALFFGGLFLVACWAATDYDAAAGRDLRYLGMLLVGTVGVAIVLHYPWFPGWAAANGCRPDPE